MFPSQLPTKITTCGKDQVPQYGNGTKLPATPGPSPPSDLAGADNWGHMMWNKRDVLGFVSSSFFEPKFHYVDHPSGLIVSTPDEMVKFASSPYNISSDAKLMNRTYYEDPKSNLAIVKFTICGTNDKSIEGFPATGKKFSVAATEYIFFSAPTHPPGKMSGGDMYYDTMTILKQPGLVNATKGK